MTSETEMDHLVTLKQLLEQRPWLTERYVRRLVSDRRIGFYKPAGVLLFDVDEVDVFVLGGRVEPTPTATERRAEISRRATEIREITHTHPHLRN